MTAAHSGESGRIDSGWIVSVQPERGARREQRATDGERDAVQKIAPRKLAHGRGRAGWLLTPISVFRSLDPSRRERD